MRTRYRRFFSWPQTFKVVLDFPLSLSLCLSHSASLFSSASDVVSSGRRRNGKKKFKLYTAFNLWQATWIKCRWTAVKLLWQLEIKYFHSIWLRQLILFSRTSKRMRFNRRVIFVLWFRCGHSAYVGLQVCEWMRCTRTKHIESRTTKAEEERIWWAKYECVRLVRFVEIIKYVIPYTL